MKIAGRALSLCLITFGASVIAQAQTAAGAAPIITKIDPPGWFAGMPKPMLLVEGEHLAGAQFHLSDKSLHLDRVHSSTNGHWVELWLDRSPARAETIQISASAAGKQAEQDYTFAARRKPVDGFAGFSSRDVMYLIMTDRFADGDPSNDHQPWDSPDEKQKIRGWHGGDLRGIINHLDYIQQLGVTAVWITPVYANHGAESYHGYGATDLYAVDEHYGTLSDLKDLAAALHGRGMKLVLDMVPNHVGAQHPWVTDPPEPDWFHGTKEHHDVAQGDFAPLTDPHSSWRDRKDVTVGWFANVLPDMNQENAAAAQYLIQNAEWWVEEAGVDGIRLDTFPYVGRAFWQTFHSALHQLHPRLTTVGEVFNGDPIIVSSFAGGVTRTGIDTGLDTPFDFPSYFALRDVFVRDAPLTRLADVLAKDALYPHPERLVPFLGNHDTKRFLSEDGATAAQLKMALAVLTTMRGMPQIYSGDEIASTGGEDPDNRRNFPGGFPADQHTAFSSRNRIEHENELYEWVATLLRIRSGHAALQTGGEQVILAKAGVMAYVRGANLNSGCTVTEETGSRMLVAINNEDQPETLKLRTNDTSLEGCKKAASLLGSSTVKLSGSEIEIDLGARDVGVFSLVR